MSHADFMDYAENAGHKVPRAVRMKCEKRTFWIASTAYARALRVICELTLAPSGVDLRFRVKYKVSA